MFKENAKKVGPYVGMFLVVVAGVIAASAITNWYNSRKVAKPATTPAPPAPPAAG